MISCKTLIIAVWFGTWPDYLGYFLKSLSTVPGFSWMLVSDNEKIPFLPENLHFHRLTLDDFQNLAGVKLGLSLQIANPKKLCDFKPLYGKIFEDHLANYQYWGYCDIDMIFGRLGLFLDPLIGKYDVISCYKNFLSGPFCMYRNSVKVNELFREHSGYKRILQNPDHLAFDENIPVEQSRKEDLCRIRYPIRYLFNLSFAGSLKWREIRYQYQWFVKRFESRRKMPGDMTEIVFQQAGQVSASFNALLHSDRSFQRKGSKSWEILWNQGVLTDTARKQEIFAFHFVDSKSRDDFTVPPFQPDMVSFTLTSKGFRS